MLDTPLLIHQQIGLALSHHNILGSLLPTVTLSSFLSHDFPKHSPSHPKNDPYSWFIVCDLTFSYIKTYAVKGSQAYNEIQIPLRSKLSLFNTPPIFESSAYFTSNDFKLTSSCHCLLFLLLYNTFL